MTDPTANSDQPKTVTPDMPAAPPWPEHDWHLTEQPITEMDDRGKVTTVWPQTSERDAHLGAYVPFDDGSLGPAGPDDHDAEMFRKGWMAGRADRAPSQVAASLDRIVDLFRAELPRIGEAFTELTADPDPDPAPTGLTAAQEIRARALDLASQIGHTINWVDLGTEGVAVEFCKVAEVFAVWIEHGPDETPQIRDWATTNQRPHRCEWFDHYQAAAKRAQDAENAACPDPAIHDADLHEAARIADARDQYRVDAEDWRRRTIAAGLKLQNLEAERCPDPGLHEETHPLRVMAGQANAARDEALAAKCPDRALHEEDWVKHKYGQVADANADAAKALGQVAVLEQQLEQIRYERHLLGVARLTLDLVASGAEHGRSPEQIRAEAEDVAQRIVDEIGHPVTDEPALGPSYREQLAALKTELLEAHADLEASLAREQIAAERIDAAVAYMAELAVDSGRRGQDLPAGFKHIRAILVGDQGEEAQDA